MTEEAGNPKIIRFSQKDDEVARNNAKKVHQLAVLLKQAGFPVRTIAGKIDTLELRKRFDVPRKNDLTLIELQDQGKEKNDEVKDWLLLNSSVEVKKDIVYKYSDGVSVYQLVVNCNKL